MPFKKIFRTISRRRKFHLLKTVVSSHISIVHPSILPIAWVPLNKLPTLEVNSLNKFRPTKNLTWHSQSKRIQTMRSLMALRPPTSHQSDNFLTKALSSTSSSCYEPRFITHKTRSTNNRRKGKSMNAHIIHSDDAISTRLFASWITERYSFNFRNVLMV